MIYTAKQLAVYVMNSSKYNVKLRDRKVALSPAKVRAAMKHLNHQPLNVKEPDPTNPRYTIFKRDPDTGYQFKGNTYYYEVKTVDARNKLVDSIMDALYTIHKEEQAKKERNRLPQAEILVKGNSNA